MKFRQLIEYNTRTVFLKNHFQNVVEKLFPDPFLKNQNSVYLLIHSQKFLYSLFLLHTKWRAIKLY